MEAMMLAMLSQGAGQPRSQTGSSRPSHQPAQLVPETQSGNVESPLSAYLSQLSGWKPGMSPMAWVDEVIAFDDGETGFTTADISDEMTMTICGAVINAQAKAVDRGNSPFAEELRMYLAVIRDVRLSGIPEKDKMQELVKRLKEYIVQACNKSIAEARAKALLGENSNAKVNAPPQNNMRRFRRNAARELDLRFAPLDARAVQITHDLINTNSSSNASEMYDGDQKHQKVSFEPMALSTPATGNGSDRTSSTSSMSSSAQKQGNNQLHPLHPKAIVKPQMPAVQQPWIDWDFIKEGLGDELSPSDSDTAAPTTPATLPINFSDPSDDKAVKVSASSAPEHPRGPLKPLTYENYDPRDFPMFRPIEHFTDLQIQAIKWATAKAEKAKEAEAKDEK